MGILDNLLNGAKNVVDFAEDKATSAVEFSKLKYKATQLNNEFSDLCKKLGTAVYTMIKSDYEDKDLINSLVEEIDEVKDAIDEVNQKIADRKDKKVCPACDTANEKDSAYCTRCGNRFEETEE